MCIIEIWVIGREADCIGLLNQRPRKGSTGSNPVSPASIKYMDETYLKLHGWIPLRFEHKDEVGLFLYNPYMELIVNKKDILRHQILEEQVLNRMAGLSYVTYNDIPNSILEQAMELSRNDK